MEKYGGAMQKTASNVIIRNGMVLLILEGEGACNCGLYSVPGGRCRPGESPDECSVREAMEEASVCVRLVREIANFPALVFGNRFHGYVYEAEIVSGEPRPGDGIKAVRWATLDELEALERRGLTITGKLFEAVRDSLAGAAN